jgi:mannose-6-phosphate isomerase-like protein (cupin superfamily)
MGSQVAGLRNWRLAAVDFITGKDIEAALAQTYRVYLCGNLERPQDELVCMPNYEVEIGISDYREFTADRPHFHTTTTEYNYVLHGTSRVYLIDSDEEHTFEEGSLFVIPPRTRYASKHVGGTRLLFFKSPGGNDKRLVDPDVALSAWLETWN